MQDIWKHEIYEKKSYSSDHHLRQCTSYSFFGDNHRFFMHSSFLSSAGNQGFSKEVAKYQRKPKNLPGRLATLFLFDVYNRL